MKIITLIIILGTVLTGCAGVLEKQQPICSGIAFVGGQEITVQIYDVRKVVKQTEYKAGQPFGWHWVSKANFISTTC